MAVACKPLFGPAAPPTPGLPSPDWPRGAPACGTPRGTRAALPPTHANDAPGRVALAGSAAAAPCARGRRACTGVRRSARCPRPLRTWTTRCNLNTASLREHPAPCARGRHPQGSAGPGTVCGRGRDTSGAPLAPARVYPPTAQLPPPCRVRPCGPRQTPTPRRWEGRPPEGHRTG